MNRRRVSRPLVAALFLFVAGGAAGACGSTPDFGVTDGTAAASGTSTTQVTTGPRPFFGQTITQQVTPPPLSGGTLTIAPDGHTAVAADPDRDQVYVVDLLGMSATTIALQPGDEPGRVVVDGHARAHVALRSGGAIVTIDLTSKTVVDRTSVCVAPRGVAYDASTDSVFVACESGELVQLPALGGAPTRTVTLERDLRDVVVLSDHLLVSRFRSAEVLHVSKTSWSVDETDNPPASGEGATPSVAWRLIPAPGGAGAVMIHQRGQNQNPVAIVPGGYGGGGGGDSCDRSIIESAITTFAVPGAAGPLTTPAISDGVLPVDIALATTGPWAGSAVIIAAGNGNTTQLPQVITLSPDVAETVIPMPGIGGTPPSTPSEGSTPVTGCVTGSPLTMNGEPASLLTGQATAVAIDGDGQIVVQTREPASLYLAGYEITIPLSMVSRKDTGQDVFNSNTGAHIACASCHAEGGDDGRVWTFEGLGPRRTPSLRGTVQGTAPYHWGGEEKDFPTLVHDVYTGRMSGAPLASDQQAALATWVNAIPAPPAPVPADPDAVARGDALFHGEAQCVNCHEGAKMTNNLTVDVGTGGAFQVPPLIGVAYRAPFLHMGCAATLTDRFTCGGDKHGNTASLSSGDIADLVAYLETL